jgi:hypothetical protein
VNVGSTTFDIAVSLDAPAAVRYALVAFGSPDPDEAALASLSLQLGQDGIAATGSFFVTSAYSIVYHGVAGGVVDGEQTISPGVGYYLFTLTVCPLPLLHTRLLNTRKAHRTPYYRLVIS